MLLFWLWLLGFVVYPWLNGLRTPPPPAADTPPQATRRDATPAAESVKAVQADVKAARELLKQDPDRALVHIERALETLAQHADLEPELVSHLERWAAYVHVGRWHYHRAREALERARDARPSAEIERELARVEQAITAAQYERDQETAYRSARDGGYSGRLTGTVAVAYLMLERPVRQTWSTRDRVYVAATLDRVQGWYQAQADRHDGRTPRFVNRYFLVDGDFPARYAPGDFASPRNAATAAAVQLGYASLPDFLAAVRDEAGADAAMLMLHAPRAARSYSIYCAAGPGCRTEIAFINERPGRREWDQLAYTQAHEGLHLFGADDLYNLRDARDYAPTDVMNYPSARLDHATVEELTAWAVGWRAGRPRTPFPIEEL